MITLWLRDCLVGKRLEQQTRDYLSHLQRAPVLHSQKAASQLLTQLRREPGPHVQVGETMWGEPVIVPLIELVKATSFITGGMGTGKTMFDLLVIQAIIKHLPTLRTISFGVLDAKGELFERTLYLLAMRLAELEGAEREELLNLIVILDRSSRSVISPDNILACPRGSDLDFFVTSRLETLRELLSADDKLSLRGATMCKPALMLLTELGLPLTYLELVLSDEVVRHRLVSRSRNPEVRYYFQRHFPQEPKSTIAALRARIAALLASESVRLALAGSSAPDFLRLQNEGKIALITSAGPTITRGVSVLFDGLDLSDIRQEVFRRPNDPPVTYLWCVDEAQNFFLTRQQQSDLIDLVTMGRSFGTFFSFLCQNLSASVADGRMLKQLFTNVKWTLTLRGTPQDAQFLRAALPVMGRRERPDPHPFHERTLYSPEEERALMFDEVASLEDGIGYLWLKARSPMAVKIRTQRLDFPKGEKFRSVVDGLREDPQLGGRLSRGEYQRQIAERDRQWLHLPPQTEFAEDRWEKTYREQEAACQA